MLVNAYILDNNIKLGTFQLLTYAAEHVDVYYNNPNRLWTEPTLPNFIKSYQDNPTIRSLELHNKKAYFNLALIRRSLSLPKNSRVSVRKFFSINYPGY
jgi:hypothetical protein